MDNETLTFEDRLFVNPEVSMAEQDAFMDKFRALQGQNQAQINQDTYNLGTPVSSNLGGLIGAEGRWNTQYQRPQVNAAIENARMVNIQQAVNTAMQNQQNAMANRIEQAKRAYYRAQQEASARDRANANKPSNTIKGDVGLDYGKKGTVSSGDSTIKSNAPGTSVVRDPNTLPGDLLSGNPNANIYDSDTGTLLGQDKKAITGSSNTAGYSDWEGLLDPFGWLTGVITGTKNENASDNWQFNLPWWTWQRNK